MLDSALRTDLVDAAGVAEAARLATGRRSSLAVQDLRALADARAESPLESRVRLRCVDGGCPPDELRVLLRDEHGHVVARGGLEHSAREALHRDRWRADALVALGHDIIRCTWADALVPGRVPATVRAAR